MTRDRMISLLDLSPAFSTRKRGAETYFKLLPLLQDGPVVLDLDGIELMPVSFLDGLMLRLMESGHAEDVTFKATNSLAIDKLRRLSGLRDVDIFLHRPSGRGEKLEPRTPDALQVHYPNDWLGREDQPGRNIMPI